MSIDLPVKFSTLTLRNRSDRPRRLSVTGYVEWVLGDERAKNLMHVVTELDAKTGIKTGAVFARNGYNTDFADRTPRSLPSTAAPTAYAVIAAISSAPAARRRRPPRWSTPGCPAVWAQPSTPAPLC